MQAKSASKDSNHTIFYTVLACAVSILAIFYNNLESMQLLVGLLLIICSPILLMTLFLRFGNIGQRTRYRLNFQLSFLQTIGLGTLIGFFPSIQFLTVPMLMLLGFSFPIRYGSQRQRKLLAAAILSICFSMWLSLIIKSRVGYWEAEVMRTAVIVMICGMSALIGTKFTKMKQALDEEKLTVSLLQDKLHKSMILDPLTGLYNRRYLDEIMRQQISLCNRGSYQFSLGFIDLDNFKCINDEYGHPVGDEVLRRFSAALSTLIREYDYAVRLGGEEFVVVLVTVDFAEARRVAERIQSAIQEIDYSDLGIDLHPTLSMGLVRYQPPETAGDLIARADKLMYVAKKHGKNQVVVEQTLDPVVASVR